ncbi:MAG: BlaI/MecI/CopY family transcriptional regulator [Acidobacteria bacterium]|nr:BlaI/MecI/CopY family transcriptional regulator [Acidobacteriota bacterium]
MRKGRSAREIPPPLELQCLDALWAMGEANVQAVRDRLAPRKPLAYTTVMTMLDRLARKGLLSRRKVGRSFVYTPLVGRDEIRRLAVRELVDSLFDGDGGALRAYLNGTPAEHTQATDAPGTLDAVLL